MSAQDMEFIETEFPIRKGCQVTFYRITKSKTQKVMGEVIRSWYTKKNIHVVQLRTSKDKVYTTSAWYIYNALVEHIPGELSKEDRSKWKIQRRREKKRAKREKRRANRMHGKNRNRW